ncbi:hypothetical protein Tco_0689655 [Tanacetum coccineum]
MKVTEAVEMAMIAMILDRKLAGRTEERYCGAPTGNALTWWNSHVKTVSHEVAYGMTWKTLKKMMTDKYCPRGEIKKLEIYCGTCEKKEYAGTLPLCNKCKFHHNGPCTVKCANCKRVSHRPETVGELKSRNQGNQAGGTNARGIVHALGEGETDQDLDNMEDDINA